LTQALVISHLDQLGKPSEFEYTRLFWQDIGRYGVYIGVYIFEVVVKELSDCSASKAEKLFGFWSGNDYKEIPSNSEVDELAKEIIKRGILPAKSAADSLHIAYAIAAECDYLPTWNMKHLENIYTNDNIRILTTETPCKPIFIVPPSMLLGGELQ
jgi:hypothetical protein